MNAMRKVRSGGVWVLGLALLGLASSIPATAAEYGYELDGTSCIITDYHGAGGDVVIPGMLGGGVVRSIADGVGYNNASITSVFMPASIHDIGHEAFSGCINLTRVTVSSGQIYNGAFRGCPRLRTVRFGAGVVGYNSLTFRNCPKLEAFVVSTGNPNLSSMDGVLYNKAMTEILRYPSGKAGKFAVPKTIRRIGDLAFDDNLRLTAVRMGNLISEIHNFTFNNCSRLTGVMIGSGLTAIGERAFARCPGLTTVCIGGNAPTVAANAFENSPLAIIYYLPWTTGWGATFGGRPTKAGDRYEPDNSKSAAKVIRNGKTQIRCIHAAGNADWVKFTVGGGGALNLKLETVGASGNTEMWLYNASGRQIAYDDDSGSGSFSRIRVASLPPGTYYAKIRGYGNGTVPFFWLTASWTPR